MARCKRVIMGCFCVEAECRGWSNWTIGFHNCCAQLVPLSYSLGFFWRFYLNLLVNSLKPLLHVLPPVVREDSCYTFSFKYFKTGHMLLLFLTTSYCWLMLSVWPAKTSRSFWAPLLPSQISPILCLHIWGFFCLRDVILYTCVWM